MAATETALIGRLIFRSSGRRRRGGTISNEISSIHLSYSTSPHIPSIGLSCTVYALFTFVPDRRIDSRNAVFRHPAFPFCFAITGSNNVTSKTPALRSSSSTTHSVYRAANWNLSEQSMANPSIVGFSCQSFNTESAVSFVYLPEPFAVHHVSTEVASLDLSGKRRVTEFV